MRTTSFATLMQHFFGNQVRISRKGGATTKKLLKGLIALTVTMDITTSAHADGWIRVSPAPISEGGTPSRGSWPFRVVLCCRWRRTDALEPISTSIRMTLFTLRLYC